MPIYEYEALEPGCELCATRFEWIQKMSEPALKACPKCGRPVKRVISQAAFAMDTKINYDKAANQGFTTYKKSGQGQYERVAGTGGPAEIDGRDL